MKGKLLIKKLLACTLLVLACATLCVSWVTVPDNKYTREAKEALDEFEDEVDELSDQCKEAQEMLDEEDIDISIMPLGDNIEKFYNIMEDLALSPMELAEMLPMMMQINSVIDEMEKHDEVRDALYYVSDVEEMVETLEQVEMIFMVIAGFFVFTVFIDAIYLLLHVFNRKAAGGWSITLHIIWAAIVTGAVVLVNFAATEEFNFEVLEMTYAPYVGVVLLIVSAIIWGSAKKDLIAIRALKNAPQSMPVQTPVNPAYAMPAADPVVASPDSAYFGNSSENEFEEVAQEEKEELVFCAYCGNQIAASAAFCKYCGAKTK